jgi:hypothetical protein
VAPAYPPRPWNVLLPISFAIGSAVAVLIPVLDPRIIGSHALIYTGAAEAWLSGGDPWRAGPPDVVFAGPPTMLLPFGPFVGIPGDAIRLVWVVGMALVLVWTLRHLRLPGYWIAFPPFVQAVILGHPEILVLFLLVLGGWFAGAAALIKPYAGVALLAERNLRGLLLGAVGLFVLLPFLPWTQFFNELPFISSTLARQSHGESVFGQPILMGVAIVALLALGLRRGLWLSVPVLWPYAQPLYQVITAPALSPLIAVCWALPIPGGTLAGIVLEALLLLASRRVALPTWLRAGIGTESSRLGVLEGDPAPQTGLLQSPGPRLGPQPGVRE